VELLFGVIVLRIDFHPFCRKGGNCYHFSSNFIFGGSPHQTKYFHLIWKLPIQLKIVFHLGGNNNQFPPKANLKIYKGGSDKNFTMWEPQLYENKHEAKCS